MDTHNFNIHVLALSIAVALVASPTPTTAQTVLTSPIGMQSIEGNTRFFLLTDRRYQCIDNSLRRNPILVKQFALRRDGQSASGPGVSTVDLTLDLGTTSMQSTSGNLDRNYLPGTRTRVFKKQRINWPDWSTPTSTPAPFDLRVPLNNSFSYNGQDALVWDLVLERGTNTRNIVDRAYVSPVAGNTISLGSGCTATGQGASYSHTLEIENSGAGMGGIAMRIKASAERAPAGTPAALGLALRDSATPVPGWCTRVHALPLLVLPMGRATGSGQVYSRYFNFRYSAAFQGRSVVTQMYSSDSGQAAGLALSNGMRGLMPFAPSLPTPRAAYAFYDLTTGINGFVFHGGAIVAEFRD